VAAHEGVSLIDLDRQEFTNFTTLQGLGANDVYAVIEKDNKVYLGTSNGLAILHPIKRKGEEHPYWDVKSLGQNQGLGLVDFAENSFSFDKDGRFWASLVESLIVIDPIPEDTTSYPTYITGINILDKMRSFKDLKTIKGKIGSIDSIWIREKNGFHILDKSKIDSGYLSQNGVVWETVKGPYDMPVGLQLPYTQNYLSFSFAGLQFSNPDKLVYRYILEGIDKNWSPISANSTSENYRDLPPGNYTFKVASKGFNGVWSQPAELSFIILPPWWQTWWAYAIFVLLFLGLGVAILNYRSRWLKRENRILEEKVNERTAELKKTIHELENTQSQLIQSEKMASLGELTAGIAHEIQNPMNFINNFSEVTMELVEEMCEELGKLDKKDTVEALDLSKDIVQNLEKITHHGKRASSIVRGMLEHSRNSSGQMEYIDINVLCDEYLRLAYHGLRAKDKSFNADFKTDFDETLPKVQIIPQDLGRVVLNIINNAFFAVTSIPEQERAADFKPLVTVSTKNMGDQVLISIRDNGPGIPQEIKDKIFQPFFTTKPTGKGTGLGLSLAYDIVTTGHGGAIELNTAPGEGTEFVIYIPIRE
jgi:signal transduction histidine kinase